MEEPGLQHDPVHGGAGQHTEGHPGGGGAGERQAPADILLHKDSLSVVYAAVRGDYVADQFVQDFQGGISADHGLPL